MESDQNASVVVSDLIHTAREVIAGSMHPIEGCRKILNLASADFMNDPLFLPIIGFVSETDDFLIGAARANYALEYVERTDNQNEGYIVRVKHNLFLNLQAIIDAFSNPTGGVVT